MVSLRMTGLAFAALLGSSMMIGQASAMPANGLAAATNQIADGLQDVRYVCGPYRCWWTPGPYWGGPYYGYAGPGPYWHRGWGWRRRYW